MNSLGSIETLFAHDDWANRATLASLRRGEPPREAVRLFAHLVGCEHLWLARLKGEASPLPVWPELTIGELADRLDELRDAWRGYLEGLDGEALSHAVGYTNSKGERWTSTVESILLHLPLHNHYHRGQIASALREAGLEPAYTDLIHATRTGAVR